MIRAEITAKTNVSGRWRYAWKERAVSHVTGGDVDPLGYRQGTATINPAVELNNQELTIGTIVWLKQRGFVAGQMWYEFTYTPPATATAITWNRSMPPGSGPFTGPNGVWTSTGTSIVLANLGASPGLYQLMMEATGFVIVTAFGSPGNSCANLVARLDDGLGQPLGIRGTSGVVSSGPVANASPVWGTHTATVLYTVPAATNRTITVQVQCNQQAGGTATIGLSTSLGIDACAIWWAKIG